VVQKHQTRSLHYDFRLERDGVFKSWAVPKGIPETVGTWHLAVQVPDHALEYGSFQGTIPQGHFLRSMSGNSGQPGLASTSE
jgi:bifunctional non-homologous end joining protein LigD